MFDVRSLILNLFGEGFDNESAALLWYVGIF